MLEIANVTRSPSDHPQERVAIAPRPFVDVPTDPPHFGTGLVGRALQGLVPNPLKAIAVRPHPPGVRVQKRVQNRVHKRVQKRVHKRMRVRESEREGTKRNRNAREVQQAFERNS